MIHEGLIIDRKCIRSLAALRQRLFDRIQADPGKRIAFFGYTYQTASLIVEFEKMAGAAFHPVCVIDNHKQGSESTSKSIPILSFEEADRIADEIDWVVVMIDSASIYPVLSQVAESRLARKELFVMHRESDPLTENEFRRLCDLAQETLTRRGVIWNTDEKNWYCCYQYLKQVSQLSGDVAEFGVFQGGSAYFMALAMACLGMSPSKALHLFDTFAGIPTKSSLDFVEKESFAEGNVEKVRELMCEFEKVQVVQGDVQETVPVSGISSLALAHVDCDQHAPTRFLCEQVYPKMVPGGIMMFQNYSFGAAYGERIAVDRFFEGKPEAVMFGYDGAAFVVKI